MLSETVPPLVLDHKSDNPEHYQFLGGRWEKKPSVGRKEHSVMGRVLYALLRPIARDLGCQLEQEWTVIQHGKKIIPDLTFSHPHPVIESGYLLAPALLVVESRSSGQSLQSLIDKCIFDHHPMGTPYCWIIDIEALAAYECHAGVGEARRVDHLSAGQLISVSVAALFRNFASALE